MAKNRLSQTVAVRFGPAIKALLLCFLIGGSAIGYVWEKSQISYWSEQIRKSESRLNELRLQNKMRADQLAGLTSPVALDLRVKQMNLGLAQPSLSQIVRLAEPAAQAAGQSRDVQSTDQQFAAATP